LEPIALPDVVREAQAKRPALLRLIGNTPLVPIERLKTNPNVRVLAKLEGLNPGGSVKDRIGLSMIEAAERSGELRPGKTILEPTSGNTGIGLAMVAATKGYPIILVLSEGVSVERRQILKAFGAEFILTPAELGTDGAIEVAYEMAGKEPDRYFLCDQYNNPNNPLAHYYGTGIEVWQQTQGHITHFVSAMGTTGTLMGAGRRLRELNPDISVVCVEPYLGHRIQGLKNLKEAYVPGIFDRNVITDKVNVEDEVAFETTRRLAKEEGILAGMSAGAAMHAALELAESLDEGVVVVIVPDGGERYLSTPLFQVVEDVVPERRLCFLNTLTRREEPFESLRPGKASIYACGPTAHALPHLGLMRRMIVADLVRRTLEYSGYEVALVMNITDIDDKTLEAAEAEGVSLGELTERHIGEFQEDMETLGIKPASRYPRASEHVDDMIATTRKLVDLGIAYEKHRSVYFSIGRFPHYGNLSGVDLAKIRVGATVDLESYDKDNPRDFTLLKRSTLAEIRKGVCYKTEWGNVRPAWHVECAAITMATLGDQYDIHLGGHDLVFPHHENEIAVCQSLTGKQPAKVWLHSQVVTVDGKKMSHSLGNAITVRQLLDEGYTGREVRFYLLSTNYRQPFRHSREALDAAVTSLRRLDTLVQRLRDVTGPGRHDEAEVAVVELKSKFNEAIYCDLNLSAAIAALFHFVRWANRQIDRGRIGKTDAERLLEALEQLDTVLGTGFPDVSVAESDELDALLREREEAREVQDWERADAIREELATRGVSIVDTPEGPRVTAMTPKDTR
jgi:cysteinyl-tRNA synthetase